MNLRFNCDLLKLHYPSHEKTKQQINMFCQTSVSRVVERNKNTEPVLFENTEPVLGEIIIGFSRDNCMV